MPYHIENVLWHLLAAGLFWRLLHRLKIPAPGFAASLMALHPVMVQSVAWITERKNVLSLALFLGALLAYGRLTRYWAIEENAKRQADTFTGASYACAMVLFLAAYTAKATAFAFPAVVLLLCWWKRGRIRWVDVLPTLPFFFAAVALGLVTQWLEREHVGAKGAEWDLSLVQRCTIAGHSLWFYVGKMTWPTQMCFVYPRWRVQSGATVQWLWPATAGAAILLLVAVRRRIGRGPAAAVLFFAGTVSPLLGFLNGYFMRYSFVANHWAYLPSLGLIVLIASVSSQVAHALRLNQLMRFGLGGGVLLVLALLTRQGSEAYRSEEALWRATAAMNPECWMAFNFLGFFAESRGDMAQALAFYRRSVQAEPNYEASYNLAQALFLGGKSADAVSAYREVIVHYPTKFRPYEDLGIILQSGGDTGKAINLYCHSIRLNPRRAYTHWCLGTAYERAAATREALAEYREAVRIDPNMPQALENLAFLLAAGPDLSLRCGKEAVEFAERACGLTRNGDPHILFTLGMAYAEAGRFEEAMADAERAADLSARVGAVQDAQLNHSLARLYQAGKSYHDETNYIHHSMQ
ncbi:MAG TPA: tetratricopeptide repeat protein [Verrucomicrobiae bacterium]|nr:tetratricopeptide repeat protein [Verrucomicrobiae bacterium]